MLRKGQQPRLLTAGYFTLDAIVRNVAKGDYWHSAGGTSGNVSIFASALGVKVSILMRIGQDQRGVRLLSMFKCAGIDVSRVEYEPGLHTPGIVELIRDSQGKSHRFTHICPVCQTRLPSDTVVSSRHAAAEAQSIDGFDAFFFDRATPSTLRLAQAAQEAGLLVMFEPPSLPRSANAKRAASMSDIVKVALRPGQEGGQWQPNKDASTQLIIETLGPMGVQLRRRLKAGWSKAQKMPAVPQSSIKDTAGAGDWLTAGFLCSQLHGVHNNEMVSENDWKDNIEYGQRLSAVSLAFYGPHGALVALGATTIDQIAKEIAPFKVEHESGVEATQQLLPHNASQNLCNLCLSVISS